VSCVLIQRCWRRWRFSRTTIERALRSGMRKPIRCSMIKPSNASLLGISLRADSWHPVVKAVNPALPASGCLNPYDEILSVSGESCQSAEHAIQLLSNAPSGQLELIKLPPPTVLTHAVQVIQDSHRAYRVRAKVHTKCRGFVRCVLEKPQRGSRFGISFSPEWRMHSMLAAVDTSGLAYPKLNVGDQICAVNGVECTEPSQTAKLLRDSSGRVEVLIVPKPHVDLNAAQQNELQFVDRAITASTGSLGDTSADESKRKVPNDECAVCLGLLCEPVQWPGGVGAFCHHYFCKPCVRQLAGQRGQTPSCPLCRTPAWGEITPRKIRVDKTAAAIIQGRHPKEYAEAQALHRELSTEWHNRSQVLHPGRPQT